MTKAQSGASRRQLAAAAAIILAVAAILGVIAFYPLAISSRARLARAQEQLRLGHFAEAESLAKAIPQHAPERASALLIAGEAATKLGRLEDALAYYSQASGNDHEAVLAAFSGGEVALHLGRLSQAEELYRSVLELESGHALAHDRLAFVLGATGRRWESAPHLLEVIRQRRFNVTHLILLGDLERTLNEKETFALARRGARDDPALELGLARVALHENRLADAERLLQKVVSKRPESVEAQCRLGEVLFELGNDAAAQDWHARLTAAADEHPDVWLVRSAWARRRGDERGAVRCLWQAVRLDPNHRQANYQLGQRLAGLGEEERAEHFLAGANELQYLSTVLDELFHAPNNIATMRKAAVLCESLGRLPEAWAWAQSVHALAPETGWSAETIARLEPRLANEWERCLPTSNLALQIDLSSYSLPNWDVLLAVRESKPADSTDRESRTVAQISFNDSAKSAGLEFRYTNGRERPSPGAKIFETTGGGVAVLDFDLDCWPDLYFTQGCRWPEVKGEPGPLDKLFRNLGTSRFADVSLLARLGDERFSQGAAVGDYDNDGFPDLYVANLGVNRLYRNEGDGTFTDVSAAAGVEGKSWTTSAAIADFNGDGWPDIFDANYCDPRENLSLVCEKQGLNQSCSPRTFLAAEDRLLVGRGDGRFEEVSAAAGIHTPKGYGLGVVAADFDGSGRLSLFVANDETPNFYFSNHTRHPGEPRFAERGVLEGLAYDADGMAQACMGVAAGDLNGDGRLDLFVTNFHHESNTLYVQQAGGGFLDETRKANLRDGSFDLLGFGAQALDADLDGWLDLVLTNGHIDDLSAIGRPHKMPPQFYRNLGHGKFTELPSRSLGPFFQGKYLGRGLARLDWNRDGLPDFAVSQIDAPAALLTNETRGAGAYLALELRGVDGARDAIGATVRLTSGVRHWTRQLTAGDGYQASNERQLVFGLAGSTEVDELHIRWPSGREERHANPPRNAELIAIEGRPLERLPASDR